MDYYKDDYFTKKAIRTAVDSTHYKKIYPDRHCEFDFEPVGRFQDGVNAAVVAFKQDLIYGHFNGHCHIEGEKIEIKNAYGHVEHVFSRW